MIITLCGTNGYAIRQAQDALVASYIQKYGKHGLERVDGEAFDMSRLSDLTQGGSLFAANRLIIIRSASKNKTLWDALGEVVQQIPDETTIVLVEDGLDKRTRTYKQLKAHSDFKELAEPSEPDLLRWIDAQAALLGGSIDRHCAQYLLTQAGSDQWRLQQELHKLINLNPMVTKENIDDLVEPSPQASVFDLLDNALGKRAVKMRELLIKLRFSEDPYKLFGLLVAQVHTLAVIAAAGNRSADEIARSAGIHPFVVRKTTSLARGINADELRYIVAEVADLDYKLKSSGVDPWLLMEQTLNKIATRN